MKVTSSQLKQLNRQPELGMSVNRVWNGLSHYKHHRMTEAANQSRLPMGNISKWFLPISLYIISKEKGNLSFRSHPPQDFCRTASVPESSMSPVSWDFPCVASIYQWGSSIYCQKSSRWVWDPYGSNLLCLVVSHNTTLFLIESCVTL